MDSPFLAADTSAMPDGTRGYEGSVERGFRPAENRILWTGDAGLGASLDDMIAWEQFIDTTRDDRDGLYGRLSAPVNFRNGRPAGYGFGLSRSTEFGRHITGHGGALRGWRSHRLHVPSERVSIVVMFNHMADTTRAAMDLLSAVLGVDAPRPDATLPVPHWLGAYVEPETGLSVRIEMAAPGQIRLRFGHTPELLEVRPDGAAGSDDGTLLRPGPDGLWMHRRRENFSTCLQPLDGLARTDVAGRYRCEELDTEMTVSGNGGVLYGAFSGFLGQGRMEMLEPIGPDVWALPCPRALDHTPPGDWTLRFRRDDAGKAAGVEVGCWLARGLDYAPID
jgi:D-aminopeptidase